METNNDLYNRTENPPFQGDYVNTCYTDNIVQHKLNIIKAHRTPLQ